jgi:hypothetical protein
MGLCKKLIKFDAALYNSAGQLVKKLKKNEFIDQPMVDGFTFYQDDRLRIADLRYLQYPHTVVFEIETENKGLLHYPIWQPHDKHVSVQQATLEVSMPHGIALRYLEKNMPTAVKIQESTKGMVYRWTLHGSPVISNEIYDVPFQEKVPIVFLSTTDFEIRGYKGNMETWENYGLWQSKLLKGKNDLSEKTKAAIKELVKDAATDEEKVKRIYQYMQSRTRYVGVQLGIGGWQPFNASFVDEKGYGDCKALSFYTHALLDAVGVPSYYTKIHTGEMLIDPDFAFPYFNHVILCVPLKNDPLWLECTSQKLPFGYVHPDITQKNVLLITPEGGKFATTSHYANHENLLIRKAEFKLDTEGNAAVTVNTQLTGRQQEDHYQITAAPKEQQKKWLYNHLSLNNFDIHDFSIEQVTTGKINVPEVQESIVLSLRKCAAKSGKRFFLQPNQLSRMSFTMPKSLERNQDFVLKYNYYDEDELTFLLPETYYPEFLPKPVMLESPFGKYEMEIHAEEGKPIFTRKMEINRGTFNKTLFPQPMDFYQQVTKSNNVKVLLTNNT